MPIACNHRLPRGIPAASLKDRQLGAAAGEGVRLPRGIPAASLKDRGARSALDWLRASSAGNTRGLIEGRICRFGPCVLSGLPRGIPAASLKAPRGGGHVRPQHVFRGEYPRPH